MSAESENNITFECPIDNSLNLGSHNPRYHYSVRKCWYRGTVRGGLHENIWVAIKQQVAIFLRDLEDNNTIPQALESSVVHLEVGERYVPRGSADTSLVHGINDGFHGSSLLVPNPQLVDIVRNRLLEG